MRIGDEKVGIGLVFCVSGGKSCVSARYARLYVGRTLMYILLSVAKSLSCHNYVCIVTFINVHLRTVFIHVVGCMVSLCQEYFGDNPTLNKIK